MNFMCAFGSDFFRFRMQGCVVEAFDLRNATHLNGKRGIIQRLVNKEPLKYVVSFDDNSCIIKNENLLKVYCLGVPKEYRVCDSTTLPLDLLLATLSQTKSDSFYVFLRTWGTGSSVFIINSNFFEMAMDKMTTEPLLRIYSTCKSHNDSSVCFDQYCMHPPENMAYPWYFDLSSHQLLQLVSRYESEVDENEMKKMNIYDFKHGMFS